MVRITVWGAVPAERATFEAALTLDLSAHDIVHTITAELGGDFALLLGLGHAAAADSQLSMRDQSLRMALDQAKQPYVVLYGTLGRQISQARRALQSSVRPVQPTGEQSSVGNSNNPNSAGDHRAWQWACDKCSDPACEQRLLTDLLRQRAPA